MFIAVDLPEPLTPRSSSRPPLKCSTSLPVLVHVTIPARFRRHRQASLAPSGAQSTARAITAKEGIAQLRHRLERQIRVGAQSARSAGTIRTAWLSSVSALAPYAPPVAFGVVAGAPMQDKPRGPAGRKSEALSAGPERAVQRQHDKGKLLARERLDYLLDEGSFHELDMLAATGPMRPASPIGPTPTA